MSTLPDPIREALDVTPSEAEVASVWRRIRAKRSEPAARAWPRLALVLAGVAALVAVVLAVGFSSPPPPPIAQAASPGPLARLDAPAALPLAGGVEVAGEAHLSDGSRIAPVPGARLAVLENTGTRFVTLLGAGRAAFQVKPGGPRRWVVECGIATVEVVGTQFELERARGALTVKVEHGVVLVRSPHLPDRITRVVAGQSLEVVEPEARTKEPEPELAPAASTAAAPSAPPAAAPGAPAASGDPVEALYVAADRARRAGRAADAARLLEEGLGQEPSGHRAALRAFTLGRLYLEELGQPGRAARAFERSLGAGAPASLDEDVRARLVEARARMADSAGARRAAEDYRARYPSGRRRAEVDRWSPVE